MAKINIIANPHEVTPPHVFLGMDTPIPQSIVSIKSASTEMLGFNIVKKIGEEVVAKVLILNVVVSKEKLYYKDSKLI